MENVGAGNLSMPEQEMHTTAFWLHFPEAFLARFADLYADRKAERTGRLWERCCAPSVRCCVMCDPRDLGVSITEDIAGSLQTFEPNLYLYDNYPGGIGQSAPLFKMRERCSKAQRLCCAGARAKLAARAAWAPSAK